MIILGVSQPVRERVSISSAKRRGIEQFIVLRNNRSRLLHVVKYPLSLTFMEGESRGGSRNPAKTKMVLYVATYARLLYLLLKSNKRF